MTPEQFIIIYQQTWRHTAKALNLHQQRCVNLRVCKFLNKYKTVDALENSVSETKRLAHPVSSAATRN
jgi:hypothetical protein